MGSSGKYSVASVLGGECDIVGTKSLSVSDGLISIWGKLVSGQIVGGPLLKTGLLFDEARKA